MDNFHKGGGGGGGGGGSGGGGRVYNVTNMEEENAGIPLMSRMNGSVPRYTGEYVWFFIENVECQG